MSVGIVRVAKMTSGSVKGIEIHDRREKDISHTNKDIDWERTKENYDLHPDQNRNFYQTIKERISELNLPKAVRKDAVVMAQVLVTSDHDFFKGLNKEQQEQFFKDSYNFLAERYGKENVVSATVHLDEKTPHMHFNFVPVTADGRLSAKSILTRQSLIEQQTAFYEQVGKDHGLNRGQTKAERIEKGDYRKNMTMPEYKAYTAELERVKEQVATLTQTEQKALESVSKAQEKVQGIQDSIKPLQAEYEAKKAYVRECDKASQISMSIPDFAEVKTRGIFKKQEFITVPKEKWEQKHISANEKGYLQKATAEFEKAVAEFRKTSSADHIAQLEKKVNVLERKVYDLKIENSTLQSKVLSTEKEADRVIDKVNKVLGKLPDEVSDQFIKQWNTPERSQSHDRGMSR